MSSPGLRHDWQYTIIAMADSKTSGMRTSDLMRGIDHGPYDFSEVDPSFVDELRDPARSHVNAHALNDCLLAIHVWTRSVSFYAPAGIEVHEERVHGRDAADALHIRVPPGRGRGALTISISAFFSPTDTGLWNDVGWKQAREDLSDESTNIVIRRGLWGITVSARSIANEVYVIGADGPRWSVRMTVSGVIVNERARDLARDMMDSMVVHRAQGAFPPGTALDVSLIDRRKGHEATIAEALPAHGHDNV